MSGCPWLCLPGRGLLSVRASLQQSRSGEGAERWSLGVCECVWSLVEFSCVSNLALITLLLICSEGRAAGHLVALPGGVGGAHPLASLTPRWHATLAQAFI